MRLTVMAALIIADELSEARQRMRRVEEELLGMQQERLAAPARPRPRRRTSPPPSTPRPSASRKRRACSARPAPPPRRAGLTAAMADAHDLIAQLLSHLPWVKRKAAKLSHRNALNRLKAQGFAPTTVYDIGAYRGGWTRLARRCFPMRSSSCSRPMRTTRRICAAPGSPTSPWRSPPRTARKPCSCAPGRRHRHFALPRELRHLRRRQSRRPQGRDRAARHPGGGAAPAPAALIKDRRPGRRARRHRRGEDDARPLPGR